MITSSRVKLKLGLLSIAAWIIGSVIILAFVVSASFLLYASDVCSEPFSILSASISASLFPVTQLNILLIALNSALLALKSLLILLYASMSNSSSIDGSSVPSVFLLLPIFCTSCLNFVAKRYAAPASVSPFGGSPSNSSCTSIPKLFLIHLYYF